MFITQNIMNLNVLMRHSMVSLMNRLEKSDNKLVRNVLASDARSGSVMWKRWNREAFVN